MSCYRKDFPTDYDCLAARVKRKTQAVGEQSSAHLPPRERADREVDEPPDSTAPPTTLVP